MATINVGGLAFEYDPGQTYEYPAEQGKPELSPEEKARARSHARAEAIKRFQEIAAAQTLEAIEETVKILFAQLIQFRALNGSIAGHPLPAALRESADYLEDL